MYNLLEGHIQQQHLNSMYIYLYIYFFCIYLILLLNKDDIHYNNLGLRILNLLFYKVGNYYNLIDHFLSLDLPYIDIILYFLSFVLKIYLNHFQY